MSLKIAASFPDFFAHAGDSAVRRGEAFGCWCARCRRPIGAPHGFEGALVWCLYCGIDTGHVPAVESPWSHRYTFGVTREECLEDRAALDRGDFEAVAEARARRNGRIIDLF